MTDAPYALRLAARARRSIAKLPLGPATAAMEFVNGPLLEHPHRVGKPLGLELTGFHSARRGDYRVVYRIDEAARTVRVTRKIGRAHV